MTEKQRASFLRKLADSDAKRQKAHLTFRGNLQCGRHGWLRMTPAYSLHVVEEILQHVGPEEIVLDPFSGTATTALASVSRGITADSVDINPFLVWLGNLKVRRFSAESANVARDEGRHIASSLRRNASRQWVPHLHQIEKWWGHDTLTALSSLYARIGACGCDEPIVDLLKVAFCRVMIETSNVSFGHQSMSFKKPVLASSPVRQMTLFAEEGADPAHTDISRRFQMAVDHVTDGISTDQPNAEGNVILGDSRNLPAILANGRYSTVITSPPYPNRMSYIRELRPYMYWLGYLNNGRQAGELDWDAIGGTWGCATSNLSQWKSSGGNLAYPAFDRIVRAISKQHELLGKYVHRYFDDIKLHLSGLREVMTAKARCFYIVGNSKFYDTLLPVEEIYAAMFEDAGFCNAGWKALRKRNSKKELYEFVVYAETPS